MHTKAEGNYYEFCFAKRNGVIIKSRITSWKRKPGVHLAPLATLSTILFHVAILSIQEIAAVDDAAA